jgi:hypothetical protein
MMYRYLVILFSILVSPALAGLPSNWDNYESMEGSLFSISTDITSGRIYFFDLNNFLAESGLTEADCILGTFSPLRNKTFKADASSFNKLLKSTKTKESYLIAHVDLRAKKIELNCLLSSHKNIIKTNLSNTSGYMQVSEALKSRFESRIISTNDDFKKRAYPASFSSFSDIELPESDSFEKRQDETKIEYFERMSTLSSFPLTYKIGSTLDRDNQILQLEFSGLKKDRLLVDSEVDTTTYDAQNSFGATFTVTSQIGRATQLFPISFDGDASTSSKSWIQFYSERELDVFLAIQVSLKDYDKMLVTKTAKSTSPFSKDIVQTTYPSIVTDAHIFDSDTKEHLYSVDYSSPRYTVADEKSKREVILYACMDTNINVRGTRHKFSVHQNIGLLANTCNLNSRIPGIKVNGRLFILEMFNIYSPIPWQQMSEYTVRFPIKKN